MSAPSPPADAAPDPAPAPAELAEFFCYECEASVSLPVAATLPSAPRPACPLCSGYFLEPGPSPFPELDPPPPLPPGFLSGAEENDGPSTLEELDEFEDEDVEMMEPAEARHFISNFIRERLNAVAEPDDVAAATAAAISLLEEHIPSGEPPAPVDSIAALDSVPVSDPGAECSICLQDLSHIAAALKLPCSHLFHSWCIVPWLHRHNSCPLCRSRLPVPDPVEGEQDLRTTTITIRLTTTARRRVRVRGRPVLPQGPVSESPTQIAQLGTAEGGSGPANSGETVSSEWPSQPESDTVMSEARDGDGDGDGFFD